MTPQDVIRFSIDATTHVVTSLLADLSDAELMHRPAPGCNHINWQIGHCIAGQNRVFERTLPAALPALPAGFDEKYTAETAASDDPTAFCTKAELLRVFDEQRVATLAALAKTTDGDLANPCTGWTPNVGAMFAGMAGLHWMMHVGQWTVARRQLGRPPLF